MAPYHIIDFLQGMLKTNHRFTQRLTRRGKTKFGTIKWYNLCLQIIQSQTCYPLIKFQIKHCKFYKFQKKALTYKSLKRIIHPLLALSTQIFAHCDLYLWPLTLKIISIYSHGAHSCKDMDDDDVLTGATSLVFTITLNHYHRFICCDLDLWPSKKIIPWSWVTSMPGLMKPFILFWTILTS